MSDLDPEFLELEDVFEPYADSIARYGGDLGVRDSWKSIASVDVTGQAEWKLVEVAVFETASALASVQPDTSRMR